MNYSSISVKILATSLLLASTTGLAFAGSKHHKATVYKEHENYKGEMNYKGEVPCPPPVMLKDGFYLGAQVGYDSYRSRQSLTVTSDDGSYSWNPPISATGWVGGLFLGYGQYFQNFYYLGAEIFGNWSGADGNWSFTGTDADDGSTLSLRNSYKAQANYGIDVLPGLRLNDTSLGYIRLGYNWANFKASQSATVTGVGAGSFSTSRTRTAGGFHYGVGMETLVYENWSIRGDFTHTSFNSFTSSVSNASGTATVKTNPSDNQFMLGVLYHFS